MSFPTPPPFPPLEMDAPQHQQQYLYHNTLDFSVLSTNQNSTNTSSTTTNNNHVELGPPHYGEPNDQLYQHQQQHPTPPQYGPHHQFFGTAPQFFSPHQPPSPFGPSFLQFPWHQQPFSTEHQLAGSSEEPGTDQDQQQEQLPSSVSMLFSSVQNYQPEDAITSSSAPRAAREQVDSHALSLEELENQFQYAAPQGQPPLQYPFPYYYQHHPQPNLHPDFFSAFGPHPQHHQQQQQHQINDQPEDSSIPVEKRLENALKAMILGGNADTEQLPNESGIDVLVSGEDSLNNSINSNNNNNNNSNSNSNSNSEDLITALAEATLNDSSDSLEEHEKCSATVNNNSNGSDRTRSPGRNSNGTNGNGGGTTRGRKGSVSNRDGPNPQTDLIIKKLEAEMNKKELKLSKVAEKKLTEDVIGLFTLLLPTDAELKVKQSFFKRIDQIVRKAWPGSKLHMFGSTASRLCVKGDSDLDLCLYLPPSEVEEEDKISIVKQLAQILRRNRMQKVMPLIHARVPIVKFEDPQTGLTCDIGVNNMLAVYNTRLIHDYSRIDVRFRQLAFIIKYWAKQRDINQPYHGTLSSYAYLLMLIHYLQNLKVPVLPILQDLNAFKDLADKVPQVTIEGRNCTYVNTIDSLLHFGEKNKSSVGELLVGFFRHYFKEFDYNKMVVSIRTREHLTKKKKGWTDPNEQRNFICIEDPFETDFNVGRVVSQNCIHDIRYEMWRAYSLLCSSDGDSDVLSRVCESVHEAKKDANFSRLTTW